MNLPNIPAPTANTNLPISPEAFWANFSTALGKRWNQEEVEAFWFKDKNNKKRTVLMTDVVEELAQAFDCVSDVEYWPRVDVSYFDQQGAEWAEWSREAAIEIENKDSWRDEVCKLMEINAGLKVLIAYVDNQKNLDDFWKRLPKIYKSRKYVTQPSNWLFIFGFFGKTDWDFIAFKFDGETKTEITGNVRIRTAGKLEPIA